METGSNDIPVLDESAVKPVPPTAQMCWGIMGRSPMFVSAKGLVLPRCTSNWFEFKTVTSTTVLTKDWKLAAGTSL